MKIHPLQDEPLKRLAQKRAFCLVTCGFPCPGERFIAVCVCLRLCADRSEEGVSEGSAEDESTAGDIVMAWVAEERR